MYARAAQMPAQRQVPCSTTRMSASSLVVHTRLCGSPSDLSQATCDSCLCKKVSGLCTERELRAVVQATVGLERRDRRLGVALRVAYEENGGSARISPDHVKVRCYMYVRLCTQMVTLQ